MTIGDRVVCSYDIANSFKCIHGNKTTIYKLQTSKYMEIGIPCFINKKSACLGNGIIIDKINYGKICNVL